MIKNTSCYKQKALEFLLIKQTSVHQITITILNWFFQRFLSQPQYLI